MDTPLSNTAVATPAPAPAPVAPAAAAPTPAPYTPPPSSGGNGIMQTIKSLNWVEMGFGILGALGLYYTIYYYKYSASLQKTAFNEMQNKVDELNIKVSDISSSMESKKDPVSSQLF